MLQCRKEAASWEKDQSSQDLRSSSSDSKPFHKVAAAECNLTLEEQTRNEHDDRLPEAQEKQEQRLHKWLVRSGADPSSSSQLSPVPSSIFSVVDLPGRPVCHECVFLVLV